MYLFSSITLARNGSLLEPGDLTAKGTSRRYLCLDCHLGVLLHPPFFSFARLYLLLSNVCGVVYQSIILTTL